MIKDSLNEIILRNDINNEKSISLDLRHFAFSRKNMDPFEFGADLPDNLNIEKCRRALTYIGLKEGNAEWFDYRYDYENSVCIDELDPKDKKCRSKLISQLKTVSNNWDDWFIKNQYRILKRSSSKKIEKRIKVNWKRFKTSDGFDDSSENSYFELTIDWKQKKMKITSKAIMNDRHQYCASIPNWIINEINNNTLDFRIGCLIHEYKSHSDEISTFALGFVKSCYR